MSTALSQRYRYLATPEAVEVLCAAQAGEYAMDDYWFPKVGRHWRFHKDTIDTWIKSDLGNIERH